MKSHGLCRAEFHRIWKTDDGGFIETQEELSVAWAQARAGGVLDVAHVVLAAARAAATSAVFEELTSFLRSAPSPEVDAALLMLWRVNRFFGEAADRGAALFSEFGFVPPPNCMENREAVFAGVVQWLVASCWGLWESLPEETWPEGMKRTTQKEREASLLRMQQLKRTASREGNRESISLALNTPQAFVDLMDERGVFSASRAFAKQAKCLDAGLSPADEFQAGRNAWTAFALQLLDGDNASCTDAVAGYSLLYPFSDNFLDDPAVASDEKLLFQNWFRRRLLYGPQVTNTELQFKVGECVSLVEKTWDRHQQPWVFLSLVAILDAQTISLKQHVPAQYAVLDEIFDITFRKGGTSVLADLFLTQAHPKPRDILFAFALGYALQLVDDIQDMITDAKAEQQTPVTLAHDSRKIIRRLCHLLELILPNGKGVLFDGIRAMCFTMVFKQVSRVHTSFDSHFLMQCEHYCPIPLDAMAKLAGMKVLLKMVRAKLI